MANYDSSYIFEAIDRLTPSLEKIAKHFEKIDVATEKANKKLNETSNVTKTFKERLQKLSQQSSLTNNSLLRLAGGYFTLRSAINFGKDLLQTQIQMQNINSSLKAVTGSTAQATKEFDFIMKTADEVGVSFESIVKPYTKYLAASRDSVEVNRKVFTSFAKAARVYGMSNVQIKSTFLALEQMQTRGRVMSQDLKIQLGNALPNAIKLFADAAGIAEDEFIELVEQGRIGTKVLELVADLLEERIGKDAAEASKNLGGDIARLQNAFTRLKQELSTGIFSRTIATSVVFLTKHLELISKVILSIGAAIIIANLPTFGMAIVALGASFLLLLNPLTLVLGTFALLFINWKKFRDEVITGYGEFKRTFKEGKIVGGLVGKLLGKDKFEADIKKNYGMTYMNKFGFNGTLNINNAPAGSTASLTPFGSNNMNMGLNMSFMQGGGL